jgi:hypothetical protein
MGWTIHLTGFSENNTMEIRDKDSHFDLFLLYIIPHNSKTMSD